MRALLAAAAAVVLSCGVAHADPPPWWNSDPHYPDWSHVQCAGGHSGFGGWGYCDGEHYPDGTFWHQVSGAGPDAFTPHCLGPDGQPAPHGGCGGNA